MKTLSQHSWKVFAGISILFIGWGLHQIFVIPTFTDHWGWLTSDPEVVEYIKFWFRTHGIWTAVNGMFILLVAITGFRNQEQWAWWTLMYVPVHILLLTTQFYWLLFITVPLLLAAVWALWASRGQLKPSISNPRRVGWTIIFAVGLLFLYFAYDNFFVIPALGVHDPDRGWAWLTTDPEIIDYIKFYFRIFGLRVLAFGMLTIITAATGLRQGNRQAWGILFIVPMLIGLHVIVWPWMAPLLIGAILIPGIGLWLSTPKEKILPSE